MKIRIQFFQGIGELGFFGLWSIRVIFSSSQGVINFHHTATAPPTTRHKMHHRRQSPLVRPIYPAMCHVAMMNDSLAQFCPVPIFFFLFGSHRILLCLVTKPLSTPPSKHYCRQFGNFFSGISLTQLSVPVQKWEFIFG